MRERWIDTALIAALIVIAGVVVLTLFGAGGLQGTGTPSVEVSPQPEALTVEPVRIEPAQPTPTSQSETLESDSVPVVPLDNASRTNSTESAEPSLTDSSNDSAINAITPNTTPEPSEAATTLETTVQETATETLPTTEGSVDLERVGFSYVTGGVGSCNVVLEPWRHVAVSLDLRETYPCGSEITLVLNEEVAGRGFVRAVVGDSIRNAERTVNIYVGQDEPALQYGVNDGTLSQ
ncbi:MAG: hypothetical protein ACRCYY_15160 [Trueperaceae bacterium]